MNKEQARAYKGSNEWFDKLMASMPPATRRNQERRMRVFRIQMAMHRLLPWMRFGPYHFVYSFWYSILEEGVRATCKPRWGSLTFGYLNDGFKPSLWLTVYEVLHGGRGKYSGIYPGGAPHNAAEAEAVQQREG